MSYNWMSYIVAANRKLFDYVLTKSITPVVQLLSIITDVSKYVKAFILIIIYLLKYVINSEQ